jgi:hypothetical protein
MDAPFKHRIKYFCCFYAITLPIIVIVAPLLILAICNPFWFREAALIKLQRLVEKASNWRYKLLTPLRSKYDLFNVIKQIT